MRYMRENEKKKIYYIKINTKTHEINLTIYRKFNKNAVHYNNIF